MRFIFIFQVHWYEKPSWHITTIKAPSVVSRHIHIPQLQDISSLTGDIWTKTPQSVVLHTKHYWWLYSSQAIAGVFDWGLSPAQATFTQQTTMSPEKRLFLCFIKRTVREHGECDNEHSHEDSCDNVLFLWSHREFIQVKMRGVRSLMCTVAVNRNVISRCQHFSRWQHLSGCFCSTVIRQHRVMEHVLIVLYLALTFQFPRRCPHPSSLSSWFCGCGSLLHFHLPLLLCCRCQLRNMEGEVLDQWTLVSKDCMCFYEWR